MEQKYLGIFRRWYHQAGDLHGSGVQLKAHDEWVHVEDNAPCAEILRSLQGLPYGGETEHKADRVAADQNVSSYGIFIQRAWVLALPHVHAARRVHRRIVSQSMNGGYQWVHRIPIRSR